MIFDKIKMKSQPRTDKVDLDIFLMSANKLVSFSRIHIICIRL